MEPETPREPETVGGMAEMLTLFKYRELGAMFYLLPTDEKHRELYPEEASTLDVRNSRLDSGIDIPTPEEVTVAPWGTAKIDLGVRAVSIKWCDTFWLPWAYRLAPRSSIAKTPLQMANSEGIIDLGYRGPLVAAVRNLSDAPFTVKKGCALFQLVTPNLGPVEYEVLKADDRRAEKYFGAGVTERGAAGFGSTGAGGSAKKAE